MCTCLGPSRVTVELLHHCAGQPRLPSTGHQQPPAAAVQLKLVLTSTRSLTPQLQGVLLLHPGVAAGILSWSYTHDSGTFVLCVFIAGQLKLLLRCLVSAHVHAKCVDMCVCVSQWRTFMLCVWMCVRQPPGHRCRTVWRVEHDHSWLNSCRVQLALLAGTSAGCFECLGSLLLRSILWLSLICIADCTTRSRVSV